MEKPANRVNLKAQEKNQERAMPQKPSRFKEWILMSNDVKGPIKQILKMDVELDNTEVTSDLNKITFIGAIEAETRSKQVEV